MDPVLSCAFPLATGLPLSHLFRHARLSLSARIADDNDLAASL